MNLLFNIFNLTVDLQSKLNTRMLDEPEKYKLILQNALLYQGLFGQGQVQ